MNASDVFLEAVRTGDASTVVSMLDADPSLATSNDGHTSAVLLALYHQQSGIAKVIASKRDALSLLEACALGDGETVSRVIAEDPASIDRPGEDGHYPVGLAIFFGHPDVARELIERGAKVEIHSANSQKVTPLHAAVTVGDQASIRLLLDHGADPNARQQNDYVPLHSAAARGDVETARLLLRHGADSSALSADGKKPVDLARERGQAAFAEWLESGASDA